MKCIEVKELENISPAPSPEEASVLLDRLEDRHRIDILNWKDYTYRPDVSFTIAYNEGNIFLKYYVNESCFKAEKTVTNEMVCEDSCVEFFVSPGDDGVYYNIEFNGIGTILLGSGTGRADSKRVDPAVVEKIRRISSAGNKPFKEMTGECSWTLTAIIPTTVFFRHEIKGLKGSTFRANFYKCGDNLSKPHYVTWNQVKTENPDYHRPEYFGMIKFV